METTRRRSLRLFGTALATTSVAGCLSGDGAELPTQNDDGSSTDDSENGNGTGAGDVTVRPVSARPELVTRNSPDSYGTYGGRTSQWVVVEVSVEAPEAHPPDSFAVEAGGETHQAVTDVGDGGGYLAEFGDAYGRRGEDAGWLAARLPKPLEAESATLTWDGGSDALEGPVLERLRRPRRRSTSASTPRRRRRSAGR